MENNTSCQSIILELKEWKTKLIETWLPLNGTQEGVDWFKERLVELEILIATYDTSHTQIKRMSLRPVN